MFVQFLIEDMSGAKLIEAIMGKIMMEYSTIKIDYNVRSYKGIGNFRKGKDARNIKSEQLLGDLPKRLRAFNVEFKNKDDVALFIVIDNDIRKTDVFRAQLENISKTNNITIDHVFCIAVEEMEAWLLGDISAIIAAYPKIRDRIATKHSQYKQDEIRVEGTWEFLADMLTKNGFQRFKKDNPSCSDIGKNKSEWMELIGKHLNIRKNVSPSFNYFINELDTRINLHI